MWYGDLEINCSYFSTLCYHLFCLISVWYLKMSYNLCYQLYIMNLVEHFNIACEIIIVIWYYIFCMYILSLWWSVGSMECMMCICFFTHYTHILVDLCNTTLSVCWIFAVTFLVYLHIKEINFTVQNLAEFRANGKWFHSSWP